MEPATLTIDPFLDAVASRTPTPGGGAVAGYTAALAASLGSMVVAYSSPADQAPPAGSELEISTTRFQRARERSVDLAQEDQRAYGVLNDLWKKPKDDPTRQAQFPAAVDAAIAAPAALIELSLEMLVALESLLPEINQHLKSDLAIAADLAQTAARCAAWNVRANLPLLTDAARIEQETETLRRRLEQAAARAQFIEAECQAKP